MLRSLDPTLDQMNQNLESGAQASACFKSSTDDFDAQLGFLSSRQHKQGLAPAGCCSFSFTKALKVSLYMRSYRVITREGIERRKPSLYKFKSLFQS